MTGKKSTVRYPLSTIRHPPKKRASGAFFYPCQEKRGSKEGQKRVKRGSKAVRLPFSAKNRV
jgi:hypothetical protein